MTNIRIGYVPLVDCAPLVVAKELGFTDAEGVSLTLQSERSWSNVRDHLATGSIDAAHMLSPLAIAMSLGLSGLKTDVAAPLMLNLGGQMFCISSALECDDLSDATPQAFGAWLKTLIQRKNRPLRFSVPFFFSTHHYLLRYWLVATGIELDREVTIEVVPPPFVVDALRSEHVDGCVVGEPWGSLCVEAGLARIALTGHSIWPSSPEKVLGIRRDFLLGQPDRTSALLRALVKAAHWCDASENHALLAEMLARPAYLNRSAEIIERVLSGHLTVTPSGGQLHEPQLLRFHSGAAFFPWRSQARWLHAQMVRWGHANSADANRAAEVFDPTFLRSALEGSNTDFPGANEKVEGALSVSTGVASSRGKLLLPPDRFFDGAIFDPDLHKP